MAGQKPKSRKINKNYIEINIKHKIFKNIRMDTIYIHNILNNYNTLWNDDGIFLKFW